MAQVFIKLVVIFIHLFTLYTSHIHQVSSYTSDHFYRSYPSPYFSRCICTRDPLANRCAGLLRFVVSGWRRRRLTPSPYIFHYILLHRRSVHTLSLCIVSWSCVTKCLYAAEGQQAAERSRPADVVTAAVHLWKYSEESGTCLLTYFLLF